MISEVHVKTQWADFSQSQKQDDSVGMIDFNFPAMISTTFIAIC